MTTQFAHIYQTTYSGKDMAASSEFMALQEALSRPTTQVDLTYMNTAPTKTKPGMLVNADGVNWNPGSGEGTYRRNLANSAWVFLG